MLRILLVHRNFPGQFRYLAPQLIKAGHKVAVLTWDQNPNPQPLPHAKYKHEMGSTAGVGGTYTQYAELGARAALTADRLRQNGDAPDVVFGIINWGETLFLKEVWPKARHLGYAEFLYSPTGLDTGFDPEFSSVDLASRIRITGRKAHLLQAAEAADALMSPTEFQANTFPQSLRPKMNVIHDGVDTDRCAPNPNARFKVPDGPEFKVGDEVITFVNRNLEPYRGFHTFMRALPKVLRDRPNAHVVMVGGTEPGYGPAPAKDKSWKDVMMAEVGSQLDPRRTHFVGRISYDEFLSLLQVSRAHAYLTYPFVLSWSMLEAMSIGCCLIGSATEPVEELVSDGVNGRLVDFFDPEGWSNALIAACADPEGHQPLRDAARRHIVENYDLKSVCLPKLRTFVETAGT